MQTDTKHKSSRTRRRLIVVGVPTALAVFIGGSALAWWGTSGIGTGTGGTGSGGTAVTVTQVGTITGLAPGGLAQPINFKIVNPKAEPQRVKTVAIAFDGFTITAGGAAAVGCTALDFTLVQPPALNADIPASGETTFNGSGATLKMDDTGVDQVACKDVTVHLKFTAASA